MSDTNVFETDAYVPVQFKELARGMALTRFTNPNGWDTKTNYEVVYVNTYAEEVLIQVFSKIKIFSKAEFEKLNFKRKK